MIDILKDTKQVRSIYWQFNQQWCHRYDQDLVVSNQFVPASSACQAQQNLAVAESLTTFTVCCAVVQKKIWMNQLRSWTLLETNISIFLNLSLRLASLGTNLHYLFLTFVNMKNNLNPIFIFSTCGRLGRIARKPVEIINVKCLAQCPEHEKAPYTWAIIMHGYG